ncbi:MAG: 2-oxoisovalerate dehydrogenase E1 subunit beta [Nostoc sp.]|uniref:2-oxoisovalerate dehydrogenase E1 subunit beta n=1 Tax=Nostoc sp. TaxID=1180 RepID=UPI002FF699F7
MNEIVFLVEDDPDGGYTAVALTESIFTQADDIEVLREMVVDAVHCHFPNEENRPRRILIK